MTQIHKQLLKEQGKVVSQKMINEGVQDGASFAGKLRIIGLPVSNSSQ